MELASIRTFLFLGVTFRAPRFTPSRAFSAADAFLAAVLDAFLTAARNFDRLIEGLPADFFIVRNGLAT